MLKISRLSEKFEFFPKVQERGKRENKPELEFECLKNLTIDQLGRYTISGPLLTKSVAKPSFYTK